MNSNSRLTPFRKHPLWRMILPTAIFLCLSVLLILSASDSTSPWFPNAPIFELEKADQATFTLIGKHWFQDGKLPYTDLFDHKGPMIFLLNGLGYTLTGSVHGIALIQTAFLLTYCLIAYRTLRLRHTRAFSYTGVILSLVLLRLVYGGGNTVEEFGLPFHAACLLGLYKWSEQDSPDHDPRWAFIYGISIAFFILNRATDALSICLGCLIIFISLLRAKAWKNMLSNLFCGVLGVAVLILPFVLYFAHFDALDALWYGTIGYNIEYASDGSTFQLAQTDVKMLIEMCIYCVPIWACLGVGFLTALLGRCRKSVLWLALGISALCFLFKSKFYDHYVINYVPFAIVAACELDFCRLKKKNLWLFGCASAACAALILPAALLNLRMNQNMLGHSKWNYVSTQQPYDVLMQTIPEEDYDSVVLYNCWASIYLKYDICPAHTYFALQDWQGSHSEKLMSLIENEFASDKALWVMTYGGTSSGVQKILDESYEVVMECDNYRLYRLIGDETAS